MCLMRGMFFKFPCNMFVLYSESNYEWILWKFGFIKYLPPHLLPPSKDNQKQICFCYLFVLLCFVSGHIVLEGRQEIVSPIGSLTWDIKGKSKINLSEDHWVILFFTMFRDIIDYAIPNSKSPLKTTHIACNSGNKSALGWELLVLSQTQPFW